jgi:hypothetical protein
MDQQDTEKVILEEKVARMEKQNRMATKFEADMQYYQSKFKDAT